MRQNVSPNYVPVWEYTALPPRMGIRRVFKVLLYVISISTAECFLLGISFTIFGTTFGSAAARFNWIALFIAFGTLGGSLIYFFRTRFNARCLSWFQYLWWIGGATVGAILAIIFEAALVPDPRDKQLPTVIFGCIFLLYSIALAYITHLRPSLRQQINESVREMLKRMPGKQIALSDLLARLQKEYRISDTELDQYIKGLSYLEKIDVPGSNMKLCRKKGANVRLAFLQVTSIVTPELRQKVARTLSFMTEENVDIGLFLLSKEFEAVLKTYILAANAKGKIQISVKDAPDKWKLDQMINWVKNSGVITDHAVLNYLRQTRNDRAHGTMPSPSEKRVLMMSIQYLANLYIDYIKLFDDLTNAL